jgi:hypothetical protein
MPRFKKNFVQCNTHFKYCSWTVFFSLQLSFTCQILTLKFYLAQYLCQSLKKKSIYILSLTVLRFDSCASHIDIEKLAHIFIILFNFNDTHKTFSFELEKVKYSKFSSKCYPG